VRFDGVGKLDLNITGFTGWGLVDIDHIDPEQLDVIRRLVTGDPHTLLCYTTISGKGLRIIFRGDGMTGDLGHDRSCYPALFAAGNRYYAQLTGVTVDKKCCNHGRLSGLAHDPEVYYNPAAVPFHVEPTALPDTEPDSSSNSRNVGKRRSPRRHIATLERGIEAAAWQLERKGVVYSSGNHNEYIMNTGYLLNAYGVPQAEATAWACTRFADYGVRQVESIFRSCYGKTEEHGTRALPSFKSDDDVRKGLANIREIEEFLNREYEFFFNVVSMVPEGRLRTSSDTALIPIGTRFVGSIWRHLGNAGLNVRHSDLETLLQSDFVPEYHPMQRYLDSHPAWDGTTDYIGQIAATVRVEGDQRQWEWVFRKWFVGIMAGIFSPREVNHIILVLLSGEQGRFKTTWLSHLLPPELERYFKPRPHNNRLNKDDHFATAEFFIINIEELDTMTPASLNELKAMVTESTLNERPFYGHFKEFRRHIASFCGTSNNERFLTDPTGNRRFAPFVVAENGIADPRKTDFCYPGLYAQAYALWQQGFEYWFTAEDNKIMARHNRDFEAVSPEEELILRHYRKPKPGETGIFVTATDIMERINVGVKVLLSVKRIGMIMKKLGFEMIRKGKHKNTVYRVMEYTPEEILANRRTAEELTDDNGKLPF
jgi:hypothetical protein